MSLAIVLVLAVLAALAIAYPLLPGRAAAEPVGSVADADVERAVRRARHGGAGPARGGLACATCGTAYQAGDRFCVSCGQMLPALETAVCPACSAPLRPDDQFCARCGHSLAVEEVAQ